MRKIISVEKGRLIHGSRFVFFFPHVFREGEAFEGFCPARLDELLKEALRLEQHLKNQKERLRERLTLITRTLQAPAL